MEERSAAGSLLKANVVQHPNAQTPVLPTPVDRMHHAVLLEVWPPAPAFLAMLASHQLVFQTQVSTVLSMGHYFTFV